jgi:hypothetical protein
MFPLYFLVDADFTPSPGLRAWIQAEADDGLIQRCKKGDMIVVPAFETNLPMDHPTIEFVLQGYRERTIIPFHSQRYGYGHNSTDYER